MPQTFILRMLKTQHLEKSQQAGDEEDPGKITSNSIDPPENLPKDKSWCGKCLIVQDKIQDYHCSECGICCEGLDHHCVFFGKCIGKGNIWPFYGTIGLLLANAIAVYGVIGIHFLYPYEKSN